MNSASDWQKQLVERLPEPLRADPKKAAILGGLLAVMCVVMAKQFVFTGSPSVASAADATADLAASTPVDPTAAAARSDAMPTSGNAGGRKLRRADPVEQWLLEHVRPLDRNPFEFHPEFFPAAEVSLETPTARVVEDELFWDRLAKSIASRADQRKQRQIRIENLQVAAGKLRVQSTILGANPRVLIAGKMSGIGDVVEADGGGNVMLQFRILRIEGRRIILEREGVKLELPMGATRARVIVDE